MNWHPVSELPQKDGEYFVCEKRLITYRDDGRYRVVKPIRKYFVVKFAKNLHEVPCETPYPHAKAGFYRVDPEWGLITKEDNITHWAEIQAPED